MPKARRSHFQVTPVFVFDLLRKVFKMGSELTTVEVWVTQLVWEDWGEAGMFRKTFALI